MPESPPGIPLGTYAETRAEAGRRQGVWHPAQRVLVLQASPRLQRGATETVVRATVGGTAVLGALHIAGRELVAKGGVSAGVLAAVSVPLVTREVFLSRANGWRAG